jgi:hypothetical protein
MKLSGDSQNIVDFYELLNKAKEEARSIKNKPKIDRYVNSIEKLHQIFIVNHIWGEHWQIFATYIEDRDVLNVLDSLADFFYSQNPAMFLDKDFLSELNSEFASLLGKILKSDLSKELKKFLIVHLDNILKAIRRYYIDGTEGLEKATKSLVSDLVITEHRLQDVDKKILFISTSRHGLSACSYILLLVLMTSLVLFLIYTIFGYLNIKSWPKVTKKLRRSFANHRLFKKLLKSLQTHLIGNHREALRAARN